MSQNHRHMRRELDRRFDGLRPLLDGLRAPSSGWVRTIRTALGMASGDLGTSLGVTAQRVRQMEKGEVEGSLTLKSLRAAAEALDCDLVYALVPRGGLEARVRERALGIARAEVEAARRQMALEGRATEPAVTEDLIQDRAQELAFNPPREFWRR